MPTYIVLGNYTQKGIEEVKETDEKLKTTHGWVREYQGEIKQLFYTFGRYDFVAVTEFPDNNTMMKAVLRIARSGEVRTETLAAIPAEDYVSITKELP
ncbi:MAG: GYD domain-containing protein [Candidatus Hodarchaeota archaeon]